MNTFLENSNYKKYALSLTEAEQQEAIYSFSQTNSDLAEHGQVILRMKKMIQNSGSELENKSFDPNSTTLNADLYAFLNSLTNVDYRLTIYITVVSPEDDQSLGTAEVTFLRSVKYGAQYYKNSVNTANRIYPDSEWKFFSDVSLKTDVEFKKKDVILAQYISVPERIYQVAEVTR
ncbi:hypothetical protein SDC9_153198 [bioreactor metagenome]|uniref:Uncharacterized protein n=1 Tax=bioreactor metagenome TaxID=1076179 RepID=A0A645EZX7_9ZZZZ